MTDKTIEASSHADEVRRGERFAFGDNWAHFLRLLDDQRIEQAVRSLQRMLEVESLEGRSFIDVGSGSGLFSLAARRLGARVLSFDYDPQSVACTAELRRRYFPNDPHWDVQTGSALDTGYLDGLGRFDVVYSWGVLHHTGSMWQALDNVDRLVTRNNSDGQAGRLFIALYNKQQFASTYWMAVKRIYNRLPFMRPLLVAMHLIYPILPGMLLKFAQNRQYPRGMSIWYDLLDWLGGYPCEVCTPKQVFDFYKARGYRLTMIETVGGKMGCNEFVFCRTTESASSLAT